MINDKGSSVKQTMFERDFKDNLRCTRRSNMVKSDKKQLTQLEAGILITSYFKSNPDRYKELLTMEYKKNA